MSSGIGRRDFGSTPRSTQHPRIVDSVGGKYIDHVSGVTVPGRPSSTLAVVQRSLVPGQWTGLAASSSGVRSVAGCGCVVDISRKILIAIKFEQQPVAVLSS